MKRCLLGNLDAWLDWLGAGSGAWGVRVERSNLRESRLSESFGCSCAGRLSLSKLLLLREQEEHGH